MLAVVWPVLHWYDVAPLAVSVLDPPGQMDEGEAVADTFGKGSFKTCSGQTPKP